MPETTKPSPLLVAMTLFVHTVAMLFFASTAQAQLVDNPQNLLKTWVEAYSSRTGDAMARVYSRDAHLWGINSKDLSIGIESIKRVYDRTGQATSERSVTITKAQTLQRRRATVISGTMELKARLRDGTQRNTPARFTMTLVRESRRQWSIIGHHISPLAN